MASLNEMLVEDSAGRKIRIAKGCHQDHLAKNNKLIRQEWLEHRTPDRKVWVRCPMPPNTLRVHTENVLVKSVSPKVLWAESRVLGTGEYFPPIQFHGKIGEGEIGGGAIYCSFGEFLRAKSYCHLYGAQDLGKRQAYF
ncbi:uncharacterized protein TNCV_2292481 [Trichonephila clavipes]|nr:uncharacterized protein TNCV_2292481 [Trichonephila clavipes]